MAKLTRRAFLRYAATGTGVVLFMASTSPTFAQRGPEVYKLRLLHTNDHHARIEPVDGTSGPLHGGVSRRKRLIDTIRADKGTDNRLLLDAGDVFQGTLWFNQYRGQADLEFYNAMQYDAMAIGNHEFDSGQQVLADFINRATFPVLSANMVIDGSSPLAGLVRPWVIKEVGGQRIGIFGLTTEDTAVLSNPGPGVTFTPYLDAARRAVADLQAQGVNKIIALTHIGIGPDRILAAEVSGIAVVIGGHSHTPMGPMVSPPVDSRPYPEIIANPDGNPVIVAQAWEWGRWLGDLTLGFDANGLVTSVLGPPIEVLPSFAADQGFENRIAVLKQPLDTLRNQVIGESAVLLDGDRANVRTKETNLGNLVADAMLERARADGAQIAITNGGGIRTSINIGPVTVGEVLAVLPFGNTLSRVDLTGAQVKEALENGVSQVEQVAGRFPQVGGIRFTWDPAAAAGSRVSSIQVESGGGYSAIDPG
ncbi:MAG TPA: bifunctional metallophosphatase/5'-nucleotidase, partial [Roseiflexaceae bacterium]|nr:bifunctional metallophosphatase/5'-nucleotidase [Roseiflexaceae bacterium]